MSDYRSLNKGEVETLMKALRGNAECGTTLRMGKDTSFLKSEEDTVGEETINAIRSTPTHY